jgi:L-malate glycosyltransferase
MKILRLYTRLPPLLGGMENHIRQLTIEQFKLGHNVAIYYNQGNQVSDSDIQITKIPLYKIKPQFIGLLIFHSLVLVRLLINKNKFDIVHIHGDWSSLVFSKFIKKIVYANKLILTIHDQLSENIIKKKLLTIFLKPVDVIFSTGFNGAKQLKQLTTKKIIVQPSGIKEMFFSPPKRDLKNNKFTILTVANLFPKKNIELVIEIAQALKDYNFIVIGEGSHRKVLENIIQRENIENIELLGFKNDEIVKQYYYTSDCYLLTSLEEGTPTSMLEAMASGLPIVCSEAGGVKLILNKKNYIIENNSKSMFINCLSMLANKKKLREDIAEINIIDSKDYAWKNVAQNIEKYLES